MVERLSRCQYQMLSMWELGFELCEKKTKRSKFYWVKPIPCDVEGTHEEHIPASYSSKKTLKVLLRESLVFAEDKNNEIIWGITQEGMKRLQAHSLETEEFRFRRLSSSSDTPYAMPKDVLDYVRKGL